MARRFALLLAVMLSAASCGGDEALLTTAATTTTTVATTTTDATTATDAAGAIVPIEVPPCDLLTADEVAAATGFAVTEVVDDPPISCEFHLDTGSGISIFVFIEDGQRRLAGGANLFAEYTAMIADGEAATVDGVGDGAVCCPFRAIAVDAGGGRFFAIGVNGGYDELAEPLDVLTELAKKALARL